MIGSGGGRNMGSYRQLPVAPSTAPLTPPQLATLRNPICPWDASTWRHRAFAHDSLTLRSNAPQLQHLGMSQPLRSPAERDEMCLVPAVTGASLRFLVRPKTEVPGARNTQPLVPGESGFLSAMGPPDSSLRRTSSGSLHCFPGVLEHNAPSWLSETRRLPVLPSSPSSRAPSPGGYGEHRPFNITPVHLKKNGVFEARTFEARRMGKAPSGIQVWQTSAQAMNEMAHGARAYL